MNKEIKIRKRTPEEIEEKMLEIITENVILKNNWNELKEYLKDYIEVLQSQKDNVEGLDMFEEHTLENLEEFLAKMQELESRK